MSSQEAALTLEGFGDLGGQFDLNAFKKLSEDFLKSAKRIGKAVGVKILEHQQKMLEVVQRVNEGKISAVGGKRAVSRHERSIKTYLKSLKKKINWDRANAYWKATRTLVDWVGLLLSTVIKAI